MPNRVSVLDFRLRQTSARRGGAFTAALQRIPFLQGNWMSKDGFHLPEEHADLRHGVFGIGGNGLAIRVVASSSGSIHFGHSPNTTPFLLCAFASLRLCVKNTCQRAPAICTPVLTRQESNPPRSSGVRFH